MDFFNALGFLTVVRTGRARRYDDSQIAAWGRYFFPVGLFIGALAAAADYIVSAGFGLFFSSVVCVMLIALITGGLHIDGVADTFDAAFAIKSAGERLKIMKRSDIGAFGVAAVVFVILLKIAVMTKIDTPQRWKIIMIFPAISRASLLLPAYFFDYPRESGMGAGFVKNMTGSILLAGVAVSAAVLYAMMRGKGLLLLFLAFAFCVAVSYFFKRRLGGVTGDVLGCANEMTEIFVLLCAALLLN